MAQSAEERRRSKRPAAGAAGAEENGRAGLTAGGANHMIDLDFVRGLIEAVDASGIDSLEINRAGTRIRIAKSPPLAAPVPSFGYPAAQTPAAAVAPAPPAAPAAPAVPPALAPEPRSTLLDMKSPMVGTFYRGPAPEAPPYVEVGSTVSKGQTLCILEAMKLMNELPSDFDGVVREVLVEDADPVEYGQVLFRIEPTGK